VYPDVRPPDRSQVRRGAILIVASVVLASAVFVSDVLERLLVEGPELTVIAPRASELEPGSIVWVAGTHAGRVLEVGFLNPDAPGERLLIRAVLRRDIGRVIREDATAIVRRSALLAPNVLSVSPGSPELPPYDFRDTLAVAIPVSTQMLIASADSARSELETLRPLAVALRERISDGPGTWAALRRDSALQNGLRDGLGALRDLQGDAGAGGTLGQLARDTALQASLRASAERVRVVLDAHAARGWLEEESPLTAALASISGRVERLQTRFRNAEGAGGRFKYDSELADQVRLLRARVDSAQAELMSDPFRWLRFKLF